jgi:hypothetical protein
MGMEMPPWNSGREQLTPKRGVEPLPNLHRLVPVSASYVCRWRSTALLRHPPLNQRLEDSHVCDYVPWSNGMAATVCHDYFYINNSVPERKSSLLLTDSDRDANLQLDFSSGGWRVRFGKHCKFATFI